MMVGPSSFRELDGTDECGCLVPERILFTGSGYLIGGCRTTCRDVRRRRTLSLLGVPVPHLRPITCAPLRGALSPARLSERARWASMLQTNVIQSTAARRTIPIRVRESI